MAQLNNEVSTLDVNTFIELAHDTFEAFTLNESITKHPSIFLEGKPGVGKSQSIKHIAKRLENSTHKKVVVTDIRLLLFNPVDLRGIPIADKEKALAVWLKPQIFNLDESESTINILFLDELTAAPISVQAAAYQIVLDRRLGEHQLPKNTFVIAAGNGPNDGAISQAMPSALKNRFIHFKIEEDLESWLTWANDRIHPRILEFLKRYPHEFTSASMKTSSNIIVTPRSWETLSNLLHYLPEDYLGLKMVIASTVGERIASKMLEEKETLVQSIIEGKDYEIPNDIYTIHHVTEELEMRLEEFIKDKDKTQNVLSLLNEIPLDYAITLFKLIMQYETIDYEIEQLDSYHLFIEKLEAASDAT